MRKPAWQWNALNTKHAVRQASIISGFLKKMYRHLKVKLTKTSNKLKFETRSEIYTIRDLKIQHFLENKNTNLVCCVLDPLDELLIQPGSMRFCTLHLQSVACAILSMLKDFKWGQLPVVLFTHQSWAFEYIYSSKLALCQCKWGRARTLRWVLLRSHIRGCGSSSRSCWFFFSRSF